MPPPPGTTPPTPPTGATPGPQPTRPLDLGAVAVGPVPPPPGASRRRRGLAAGILAGVAVLIVPGAVVAWQALDGGGTQPHDVLPGDALGYARVDLDPSASQKIEAFRFLRKFPLFSEATGIEDDNADLRERLVDAFSASTGCDLDFQEDVEPWIGNRLGAAMLPPTGDGEEPGFALALQTDDQDAAEAAIDKVLGCDATGGAEMGRAFLDGYLIMTDTQENADRYVEAAGESPLSENAEFTETMDLLGDPGIASAWTSGSALFDTFGGAEALGEIPEGSGMPSGDDMAEMIDDSYRNAAMAFRFDDSYAELAAVMTGEIYQAVDAGVRANVPEDTMAFLGVSGGSQYVTDNWDALLGTYPDAEEELGALEDEIGISLPEDIATVFGDHLVVAVGGGELDPGAIAEGDLSTLDVGARVETDPEAFQDLWDRIQGIAEDAGASLEGVPLQTTNDGYVIASNDDYANALIDGGDLSDSDVYTTAVRDAGEANTVFFLNFDAVEDDILSAAEGQGLSDSELESLRALQAVGVSAQVLDGHTEMSLRVTAD
ncbi:DUF3352 domain-containing protein [Jiangella asiatica]|uniref:DUF3352 domain-containing protein n=1 Tax=Jiangella asiatica TaxID=2530372 RepID=A0A4R5DFH1_9ACTN|nr:DUF3352 domain-containing protein [Jiangella asiatica]TDE09143.1 DUF3352 domain-containing protein [Jiangella asiatica]